MSTNSETKINLLLQRTPAGTVMLTEWMNRHGYSGDLQHRYLKNGWLASVGYGAMKRAGDTITLPGALYSLQAQAQMPVYIGGRSALQMQGLSHFLELYPKETLIYVTGIAKLPSWFRNYKWETKPVVFHSSILPADAGLVSFADKTFSVQISGPVRAIMECLEQVPSGFDLQEAWQIMEGLNFLKAEEVQKMLVQCGSVKVKRLFLFFAQKADHVWFRKLKLDEINLGSGKRSIVSKGVYIPEYKITLPENLA